MLYRCVEHSDMSFSVFYTNLCWFNVLYSQFIFCLIEIFSAEMVKRHQKRAETASNVNVDGIVAGILAVKRNKRGLRFAAKENGIATTTLHRHIEKVDKRFPNFDDVTEDELKAFVSGKAGWKTNAVCF